MPEPSDFSLRVRRAAARPESGWVAALALLIGGALAWGIVLALPSEGGDVARARELGIVSVTIIAGYSKSAETIRCLTGVASALAASLGVYLVWALRAGREPGESLEVSRAPAAPITARELLIVSLVLLAVFSRFANAAAASVNEWTVMAEEGEMLAWVNTVLRGGALSRDTFCLYGPLSIWPVALLFAVLKPSLLLWRHWIFGVSAAASIGVYLLFRGLIRSRAGAFAATALLTLTTLDVIPGMSWSLSRVGFGLTALACLCRASGPNDRRWLAATGALLGLTTLYSQEVGLACAVGVAVGLVWRADRGRALAWVTLGGVTALAPFVAYIAARGALAATFDNLFLFPRTRVLGFCALPFPELAWSAHSLRGYLGPVMLAGCAFETFRKLASGARDMRTLTEVALFVFGLLLFSSALSRADDTHFLFALPPAFVLLVLRLEEAWLTFAARAARPIRRATAALGLVAGTASFAPSMQITAGYLPLLLPSTRGDMRELQLPRGGGALVFEPLVSDLEAIVPAIQARTAPDEPIWVFPNEALLYFLADRPQATTYPLALFAVTREQRLDLIAQLERTKPRYAVFLRYAPKVDEIPYERALPEPLAYLLRTYELEGNFGGFVLLRRKGSSDSPPSSAR